MDVLEVRTERREQMVDITHYVREAVAVRVLAGAGG